MCEPFVKSYISAIDSVAAFVGLFTFLLLWPGMLILHYTKVETFEVPSNKVIISLVIHGLLGTVIVEALWLWYVMSTITTYS